jgi:hypothetical protein
MPLQYVFTTFAFYEKVISQKRETLLQPVRFKKTIKCTGIPREGQTFQGDLDKRPLLTRWVGLSGRYHPVWKKHKINPNQQQPGFSVCRTAMIDKLFAFCNFPFDYCWLIPMLSHFFVLVSH